MTGHQGHGDHWCCIEDDVEKVPAAWLPLAIADGRVIDDRSPGPLAEGEAIGIEWSETPLRVLTLIASAASCMRVLRARCLWNRDGLG